MLKVAIENKLRPAMIKENTATKDETFFDVESAIAAFFAAFIEEVIFALKIIVKVNTAPVRTNIKSNKNAAMVASGEFSIIAIENKSANSITRSAVKIAIKTSRITVITLIIVSPEVSSLA